MVRKIIACIILFLLILSGCGKKQKNPNVVSNISPKNNPSENTISKEYNNEMPLEISMKELWPYVHVKTFNALLPDDRAWALVDVGDDGYFVIDAPPQKGKKEEIMLYNLNNNTYEHIAYCPDKAQAVYADINKKWVVWSEAMDQSFAIWRIHIYDRSKHEDKVIYSSLKDSNGDGYYGPFQHPRLYNDLVVWSPAVGPKTEAGPTVTIKEYDIIKNKITDVVKQGINPVQTDDYLIWMGKDSIDSKNPWSELYWNKNGKIQQITKNISVEGFATDGKSIVWTGHISNNPNWTIGLIENNKERRLLTTDEANAQQFLWMGSRIIAWNSYSIVRVYDRKLDKIVVLEDKDADCTNVITSNRYLCWTVPIIEDEVQRMKEGKKIGIVADKINIIDLNELK
ncbi:MAG: hypothetical protein QME45_13440 [Clostridiales bacterium]|nr:hypothetical protein [Clostridiales bacterium]